METITKAKIAETLKERLGFSGVLCEELVDQVFRSIQNIAHSEEKLVIKNFGKFRVNRKKARPGLNMHTGEKVTIPPKTILRFIPSAKFKQELNSN